MQWKVLQLGSLQEHWLQELVEKDPMGAKEETCQVGKEAASQEESLAVEEQWEFVVQEQHAAVGHYQAAQRVPAFEQGGRL